MALKEENCTAYDGSLFLLFLCTVKLKFGNGGKEIIGNLRCQTNKLYVTYWLSRSFEHNF